MINSYIEKRAQKRFEQLEADRKEKVRKDLERLNDRTEYRIIPAFEFDGVQYYQFEDINNLMAGRAFAAMDFYQELNMRCSREYLLEHNKATQKISDDILKSLESKNGTLNLNGIVEAIGQFNQFNHQLKERLEMIVSPEVVYKIASVVFFDESEQPHNYDFKYGQKKIEKWKESGLEDFFLLKPIKNLIPALTISSSDFQNYMKVGDQIEMKHLAEISTFLSKNGAMKDSPTIPDLPKQVT